MLLDLGSTLESCNRWSMTGMHPPITALCVCMCVCVCETEKKKRELERPVEHAGAIVCGASYISTCTQKHLHHFQMTYKIQHISNQAGSLLTGVGMI